MLLCYIILSVLGSFIAFSMLYDCDCDCDICDNSVTCVTVMHNITLLFKSKIKKKETQQIKEKKREIE